MNADEYVKERLEPQIEWYNKKSQRNKVGYYLLRIIEIVCAISIPLIMGYVSDQTPFLKTAAAILGVIVGVISGFLGLFQTQENWISYRTTCETLRHEKYMYLTKNKPYDNDDYFSLLVDRVEHLISKENSEWSQLLKTQKKNT
jgi:Protein of unknown function (DUF4231)